MDKERRLTEYFGAEVIDEMAYPSDFDMDVFKSLTSFAARIKYCNERLIRISSGSSRVTYKIDREKVLKLAKNNRGIAQNNEESDWSKQKYDIIARVFDVDENDLWIEMELANKTNEKRIKQITDVGLDELEEYLRFKEEVNRRNLYKKLPLLPINKDLIERLDNNEFSSEILDLSLAYGYPIPGDFIKTSSYGEVLRDGELKVVLIDFGFTMNVYKSHYSTKKMAIVQEIRKTIRRLLSEERIPFNMSLPSDVYRIKEIFKNGIDGKSFKLYVVGGSVRDAIMGEEPKDYDLATDAKPDEVLNMIKPYYKSLETGKSFGIVNVLTPSGEFEIATFRSDIGKGRRPDSVEFTTIEKDVERRDLTINSLFYDIDTKEIVDLVGGVDDLKNNVVRTVGNPEDRFDEDALRKLRAIRFAARMGADLDMRVKESLKKDSSLIGVSEERIRDEFLKGIKSAKSVIYFLDLLYDYGFFQYIFPGNLSVEKKYFIEEKNPIILIANLLKNNSIDAVRKSLSMGKYTTKENDSITLLLSLLNLNSETAPFIKKIQKRVKLSWDIIEKFAKINNINYNLIYALKELVSHDISGEDLLSQGYKGSQIGQEILKREKEIFNSLIK